MRVALDKAQIERALGDALLHRLRIADEKRRYHRGEARLELADELRQDVFADSHARADKQRPGELSGELLHARVELGRERKDALGVFERERSGGRERDAALRAIEKAGVELLLQLLDLESDRRLGHEKRLRRLGERQVFRYRMKDLQAPQTHGLLKHKPGEEASFALLQSMMW